MRTTVAMKRVEQLLVDAEKDRRCLVPSSRADLEVLRRAVASGQVVRPFPGMYIRERTWAGLSSQPGVRWRYVQRAYALDHPGEVFCSFSAALEYGLWVSKRYLDEIHIVSPPDCHGRRGGKIHRHECPEHEITHHEAMELTSIKRTVLDCCLTATFEDGLAIADSAVRYMHLDREDYQAYVAQSARYRTGADRAIRVARYMDGRSESGGESIARGMIIKLGYLSPTALQAEFVDPVDGGTIRSDMYYELPDGSQLIVEVDGKVKYAPSGASIATTQRALMAERNRESHITKLGIPVMRIQFGRIYEDGYLEHLLESYGVPKIK